MWKKEAKSGRTILLYKEMLDLLSDILGLAYINIDNCIAVTGEEINNIKNVC